MENQKIKKVQTETMYEVEFNNKFYTVVHCEDNNHQSGYSSWEIYDDNGDEIQGRLEEKLIEFILENADLPYDLLDN